VNRGALLHAQSRSLNPSLATLIALAIGAPLLVRLLSTVWGLGGFIMFDVYLLTALAGVTLIGTGLAGADPELEASTPRSGARLRLVHIVVAVTAVVGALVVGFWLVLPLSTAEIFPWRQSVFLAEAVAVLSGFGSLTAALLRARLSWVPSSLWVLLLLGFDERPPGWRVIAILPKGTPEDPFFAYAAGVVLLIGTVAYVAKRISR
jgi:hypothetical protein